MFQLFFWSFGVKERMKEIGAQSKNGENQSFSIFIQ